MQIRAETGYFMRIIHAGHGNHNQFRLRVIKRIDHHPVGQWRRVAVAGKIIAGYAVGLPHFQRNHRVHELAVAKEQHVVQLRLFKKSAQQVPAVLAFQQSRNHDHDDPQQQQKHTGFKYAQQ